MLKEIQVILMCLCVALSLTAGIDTGIAGENVPIVILPAKGTIYSFQEDKVIEVVSNQLLLHKNSYAQAKVQVVYSDSNTPKRLLVELMYREAYLSGTIGRDIYLTETVEIAIGENYVAMNGDVPVTIIPSEGNRCLKQEKIIDIVRKRLLLPSENPYQEAKVAVFYNSDNDPDYLFVYMMRKDVYSFETVKVLLENNYNVVSVERQSNGN